MKTFLKWAGNKSQIKDQILKHVQKDCRFIEPFAGSCAISLNIDAKDYLITDINADLINLYNTIMMDKDFVEYAKSFFTEGNNIKDQYYQLRNLFNQTKDTRLKSALFIYLNKHSFNGLCRYNQKGLFNSPFGYYKKPYFPEKEIIIFKNKLSKATFKIQDFRKTFSECKLGDVVYCDPPYVPISATANFTNYSAGGFSSQDQKDLKDLASDLKSKGIKVIISNHDTLFSQDMYKDADIIEAFSVQRYISCVGANRNRVNEILAVYYG